MSETIARFAVTLAVSALVAWPCIMWAAALREHFRRG